MGNRITDVHDAAVRALTESMLELGLLTGDVEECIENDSYRKYYMHGTSHWLGLDVHDVGSYAQKGQGALLEEGMVLTIEPGLYIAEDDEDAPERFRGMGIRVEDDILIAADGPINLTEEIPKTIEEIETLMG